MSDLKLGARDILPRLSGAAQLSGRGINTQQDIVTQTADGRDLNAIWDEFVETLNVYNAGRTQLVNFLTFPVTTLVEDVPVVGTINFERASEIGVARSIRNGIDYNTFGYDFDWYDLAVRYSWLFLAEAPANRIEALHASALEADNRLVFNKIMGTLFSNVNRVASLNGQPVNVYSLYNADGSVPPTVKNKSFSGSHNHYLTSGSVNVDSGDVEQLIDTIAEHGFGPQDGSTIVIMANKTDVDKMRPWRANVANANGAIALYDFIPAAGQPTLILPAQGLLGSQPPSSINGMPVVGSYGNALIVEEGYIPSGYLVAFATGGNASLRNPIGIREHQQPGLRGLRLINGERAGYPIINSYYQRGFGTGVRQRGAAAIMQLTASATYTAPAAYPVIPV